MQPQWPALPVAATDDEHYAFVARLRLAGRDIVETYRHCWPVDSTKRVLPEEILSADSPADTADKVIERLQADPSILRVHYRPLEYLHTAKRFRACVAFEK